MRIEILDGNTVIDEIIASPDFAEQHYPGAWRLAAVQDDAAPPPSATAWLIDVGPFFDRFGAAKMAVLTSTDATVRAILTDLQVRKWIDLKRPDVAQGLTYVGSVVPAVTASLRTSILTTAVTDAENLALRKTYFS